MNPMISRAVPRAVNATRSPIQRFAPRRSYVTDPQQPQRNKNTQWVVVTAGLGLLAAYYFLQGNRKRQAPLRPATSLETDSKTPSRKY